uniref:Anion transporter n=1 Tax=candidate division CPR3 bacterium TaxID=2268181 RepID=A0A7V3J8Y3_UNCC3
MQKLNLIVGVLVFLLVAIRHFIPFKVKYWHIMAFGAVILILSSSVSLSEAYRSIDFDVILSLFGMFSLGFALEESGYLGHIIYKYFKRTRVVKELVLLSVFVFGFASALLMNDTIAIVGVPVILLLAKNYGLDKKFLVLLLAFSVTTGSVLSPLGNPQNLLIAMSPVFTNPFVEFFKFLFIPTLLNLLLLFLFTTTVFREEFHSRPLSHSQEPIRDKEIARLSKVSLYIFFFLIGLKVLEFFVKFNFKLKISLIPIVAAIPLYLFCKKRWKILKGVDYETLAFFVGMFIVTDALTKDPLFTNITKGGGLNPVSDLAVIINSLFLSQIISNVPLTIFYLKLLKVFSAPQISYIVLAFASTIAGNLTVLGAASNVIIISNVEKRTHKHIINFFEFMKFGVPLTILQVVVFLLCLQFYRLIGWV